MRDEMKNEKQMVGATIIHLDADSKKIADLIKSHGYPLSVFLRECLKINGRRWLQEHNIEVV